MSVFPTDGPATVGFHFYLHAQSLIREQPFNVFGPFHDACEAAVQIIKQTNVESFLLFSDAVKIEMEKRLSRSGAVLVDYGESGRRDSIFLHSETPADGCCEGGFARSHRSEKSNNAAFADKGKELSCDLVDFGKIMYYEAVLHRRQSYEIMLINIHGAKCIGIDAVPVMVEVNIDRGIGVHLVGLADAAVKESLLRTITALQSMDFHIPGKKIVINLAPADLHKNGSGYDLPIALGIIAASGQRSLPGLDKYLIMGELGLDGAVRPVPGALPYAELSARQGLKGCILPAESAREAIELRQGRIYGVDNLEQVLSILEEMEDCEPLLIWNRRKPRAEDDRRNGSGYMDFSEIIGQDAAKRAAEVAVSGSHNLILIGSPGSGKSSLAKAVAGILPPMSLEESLATSKIYSVCGLSSGGDGLVRWRPFRAPHHSASLAAIIGGGNGGNIVPGEVSLAHNGVLFLDEFAQMPKGVIEGLRAPMEDRRVVVSRLRGKIEYPASFMLVAATNPCPCGYYGDADKCTCTVGQRVAYLSRLSGPLLDRIDLQVWMKPLDTRQLLDRPKGESSEEVRKRVMAARHMQEVRFKNEGIHSNAEMNNAMIEKYCPLSDACKDLMERIIGRMDMSARAYSRILKISRTIADLDGSADIQPAHIAEAAGYRFLDRRNFGVY